jgi:hypothetical protein
MGPACFIPIAICLVVGLERHLATADGNRHSRSATTVQLVADVSPGRARRPFVFSERAPDVRAVFALLQPIWLRSALAWELVEEPARAHGVRVPPPSCTPTGQLDERPSAAGWRATGRNSSRPQAREACLRRRLVVAHTHATQQRNTKTLSNETEPKASFTTTSYKFNGRM